MSGNNNQTLVSVPILIRIESLIKSFYWTKYQKVGIRDWHKAFFPQIIFEQKNKKIFEHTNSSVDDFKPR